MNAQTALRAIADQALANCQTIHEYAAAYGMLNSMLSEALRDAWNARQQAPQGRNIVPLKRA